jgi:HK97 family phage portal protein
MGWGAQFKSFFTNRQDSNNYIDVFTSGLGADEAFKLVQSNEANRLYDECPPLATAINKITKAISGIDFNVYQKSEVYQAQPLIELIEQYQRKPDLHTSIKNILCGGQTFIAISGNIKFKPFDVSCVDNKDVTYFVDSMTNNVNRLKVSAGMFVGDYYQDKYGSNLYIDSAQLLTIVMIKSHMGEYPLSPISAAIATIREGYNRNYKTIKNGGRLSAVYSFAENLTEQELAARRQQVQNRHQRGGVVVTSGGDLKVQELGLSPKDMDWSEQLKNCREEIYLYLGIPLSSVSTDASTFNNLSYSSVMFYEDTVLPTADYIFGVIGEVLSKRFGLQNVRVLADRESIDALQDKRVAQLKARAELGIETINELRQPLANRYDVDGGDEVLVDARKVQLSQLGNVE